MAWIRCAGGTRKAILTFPPKSNWASSGQGTLSISDSGMSVVNLPRYGRAYFTFIGTANASKTVSVTVHTPSAESIAFRAIVNGVQQNQVTYNTVGNHIYQFNVNVGDTVALEFQNSWVSSVPETFTIVSVV